jgi:hypothetical protein
MTMPGTPRLGGWLFLAMVLLAHGATVLLDPGGEWEALARYLNILENVAPVLAVAGVVLHLVIALGMARVIYQGCGLLEAVW